MAIMNPNRLDITPGAAAACRSAPARIRNFILSSCYQYSKIPNFHCFLFLSNLSCLFVCSLYILLTFSILNGMPMCFPHACAHSAVTTLSSKTSKLCLEHDSCYITLQLF
jgi:hypothetical protein